MVAEERGIAEKGLQVVRNRGGRFVGEVRRIHAAIAIKAAVVAGGGGVGEVLVTIAIVRAIGIRM